jgi:hypothetical protein
MGSGSTYVACKSVIIGCEEKSVCGKLEECSLEDVPSHRQTWTVSFLSTYPHRQTGTVSFLRTYPLTGKLEQCPSWGRTLSPANWNSVLLEDIPSPADWNSVLLEGVPALNVLPWGARLSFAFMSKNMKTWAMVWVHVLTIWLDTVNFKLLLLWKLQVCWDILCVPKRNISREVPYYEANYSSTVHPFQCAVH